MVAKLLRVHLSQRVKPYLSSDQYKDSLDQSLTFLDVVYTILFRYPWLLEELEKHGGTHGVTIDVVSSDPAVGACFTLILGAAAVTILVSERRKQVRDRQEQMGSYQSSYCLIVKHLQLQNSARLLSLDPLEALGESLDCYWERKENTNSNQKINTFLEEVLQEDTELAHRYKKIMISRDEQVELTLNEEQAEAKEAPGLMKRITNKLSSVLSTVWKFFDLACTAYWILWIGAGVFTGHFAPVGIEGLGTAGFVVPLAVGGLYPLIKIRNWWKNKYGQKIERQNEGEAVQIEEDPHLVLSAASDLSKLLRKYIFTNEKSRLKEELKSLGESDKTLEIDVDESYLSGDEQIVALAQGQWRKPTVTLISTTVNTYVIAQYSAWLITDLLKATADLALSAAGPISFALGIAFMAGSVVYGLYKAYQRYKEVKHYQAEIQQRELNLNKQVSSLEKTYQDKMKRIAELRQEVGGLIRDSADVEWLVNQAMQSKATTEALTDAHQGIESSSQSGNTKKIALYCLTFLSGATTGIMVARMMTIAGSAIFLPFAAAALSNPFTLGIFAAIGIAYGLFKAYEYYQARKEAKAKALFEARANKIEVLKEQSNLADLQIKLLKAKKRELLNKKPDKIEVSQLDENAVYLPRIMSKPQALTDEVLLTRISRTTGFSYAVSNDTLFERRAQDDQGRPRSASACYSVAAREVVSEDEVLRMTQLPVS